MKTKVLELTERRCRLAIEGTAPWFVNSLRRVLVSEVPKLAVDSVVIYDNNSALFDEIVAHRIGLLPVPTDLDSMPDAAPMEEGAEAPAPTIVRFTLSKEGPCTVYSGDLQPEDPAYAIADDKIPIVDLLQGQRLILEAEAKLGRGRDHAKWQPVHGAGYSYFVTLPGGAKTEAKLKEMADRFPTDKAKVVPKLDIYDAAGSCTLSEAFLGRLAEEGIEATYDESKFIFRFETDGSLSARQALLHAIEILEKRTHIMATLADKIKVVPAAA